MFFVEHTIFFIINDEQYFKIFETVASPNQKNIYGAALALIAIVYGSMQGIIAVASLLATMHIPGIGMDPQ